MFMKRALVKRAPAKRVLTKRVPAIDRIIRMVEGLLQHTGR